MSKRIVRRAQPVITESMKQRVEEVLSQENFILGENTSRFERDFAEYCGARHCVSVASGTAALHLALQACGVKEGDEVITVPNSFYSTASSILYLGAKPVFVDVDPKTLNMDPNALEKAVSEKTKVIMPVHLYGHPADMDPILEIAERRSLGVVEDAAEAHGAKYKGKRVGSLSPNSVTCFSFYPTKNITGLGDGGAVVTSDEEVARKIRLLRNYGKNERGEFELLGYNLRPSEIGAAILREQLPHLNEWNTRRRRIADIYRKGIESEEVLHSFEASNAYHVYYLYVIRTKKRDELARYLSTNGVETGVHFAPLLYQITPIAKAECKGAPCPVAEKASREVLSLPMHNALSDEDVHYVCETAEKYFRENP